MKTKMHISFSYPSLKYRNKYQDDDNTSMSFIFSFDNLESDGHLMGGRYQLSQSICHYETTLEYRFGKMLVESDYGSIFINGIASIPEDGDMTFSENFMFIYNGTRYTGDALLLDEWGIPAWLNNQNTASPACVI